MANTHEVLADLLKWIYCKPGWSFQLEHASADVFPKLVIHVAGYDSSRPHDLRAMSIRHYFPVPEATYNRETWRRWVFERCLAVENHEMGEWFRDGAERPFSPLHGPGEDPYTVHEFRPVTDALKTQDGSMREPYKT